MINKLFNEFIETITDKGLFERVSIISEMEKELLELEFNLIETKDELEVLELSYLNDKNLMKEWKAEGITNNDSRLFKIKELNLDEYVHRDKLINSISYKKLDLKYTKRLLKLAYHIKENGDLDND